MSVIDDGLKRNRTGWLVGDKFTVADLSFISWAGIGEGLLQQLGKFEGADQKFPHYSAWLERLRERPVVAKAFGQIAEARKAHGLP